MSPDPLFCITQQMFCFSLWSLHIMLTHISAFHLKVATITKACSLSPLEEIIFLFWDNWILTCSLKSGEIRIKRQSNGQTNYPVWFQDNNVVLSEERLILDKVLYSNVQLILVLFTKGQNEKKECQKNKNNPNLWGAFRRKQLKKAESLKCSFPLGL